MTECDEPGVYSCSRNVGSAIGLAPGSFDGVPCRVEPRVSTGGVAKYESSRNSAHCAEKLLLFWLWKQTKEPFERKDQGV